MLLALALEQTARIDSPVRFGRERKRYNEASNTSLAVLMWRFRSPPLTYIAITVYNIFAGSTRQQVEQAQ